MARSIAGPWGAPGVIGSVGQVTFTQGRRGSTVIKTKPRPSNPQTVQQQGNRGMFGWVASVWATLDALEKATYDAQAAQQEISAFAAYSQANANRWQSLKYPSKDIAATEGTPATATAAITITGGVGVPDLVEIDLTAAATDWGIALFLKNGGTPTGLRSELIHVVTAQTGAHTYRFERMGEAGDEYGVIVFSENGAQAAIVTEPRP